LPVLPKFHSRSPQIPRPAATKSHPNPSIPCKDRVFGGLPPPDRGGIPVSSGGSVPAVLS
jgi:hypothetical protein